MKKIYIIHDVKTQYYYYYGEWVSGFDIDIIQVFEDLEDAERELRILLWESLESSIYEIKTFYIED